MSSIADFPSPPPEFFLSAQANGHIWVATLSSSEPDPLPSETPDLPNPHSPNTTKDAPNPKLTPLITPPSHPIAFILIHLHPHTSSYTSTHLTQISVHPSYFRQGIATQLLSFLISWSRAQGHRTIDLTTFASVPWNRPFYEKRGFRVLSEGELEGEDARLLAKELEAERGDEVLGRWERVGMRLVL
ncbi:acyl-CoA N-acyltransferase [Dendryphion nanum]|uniref:Acyl-CoA N-acyltransferase n=1 Tax=Dendryphion nanum TaxID=256645 RepID=A0A9P9D869_9PLEO|nr:acyl-CoA N-acyltransferase [Dendryphion nanum]